MYDFFHCNDNQGFQCLCQNTRGGAAMKMYPILIAMVAHFLSTRYVLAALITRHPPLLYQWHFGCCYYHLPCLMMTVVLFALPNIMFWHCTSSTGFNLTSPLRLLLVVGIARMLLPAACCLVAGFLGWPLIIFIDGMGGSIVPSWDIMSILQTAGRRTIFLFKVPLDGACTMYDIDVLVVPWCSQ